MLQFLNTLAFICICGSLTVFAVACQESEDKSANTQVQQLSSNSPNAKEGSNSIDKSFLDRSIVSLEGTTKPHSILDSAKNPNSEKELSLFEMGLDKAKGAFSISQSANSVEDWNLVASLYRDAIALMKEVKRDSSEYDIAQSKIRQYQRQIKYARSRTIPRSAKGVRKEPRNVVRNIKRKVSSSPSYSNTRLQIPAIASQRLKSFPVDASTKLATPEGKPETQKNSKSKIKNQIKSKTTIQSELENKQTSKIESEITSKSPEKNTLKATPQSKTVNTPESSLTEEAYLAPIRQNSRTKVFAVPIKRRIGGTPIIEVIFNGERTFEMIVDTGASGTVITQQMAKSLGVVTVGKAQANTASAKSVEFPIGYVKSIEVLGARANKVAVAIAGSGLEVGLLGHDFFGDYDLTIKRDMVEFRTQVEINPSNKQSELAGEKEEVRK
ncbi:MAG: retropepsin-like aspartic protease [Cyanobacteria bacterium P01_A01_bin.45]